MIAIRFLLPLALAASPCFAAQSPANGVTWDVRSAEHLYNRAGFGARPSEIEAAVRLGHAAFVDALISGFRGEYEPFFVERVFPPDRGELASYSEDERREALNQVRRDDREQLMRFTGWWVDEMLASRHPLRERMVLFWHGHFTSSYRDVKSGEAMIRQNELFRAQGLGGFDALLAEMVHDAALLAYLDNNLNKKGNPNENLARELMELFTLGVGNYTEQDIKEAARALTGWRVRDGEAYFDARAHDRGPKTILGSTDKHDAASLSRVLLEQPACARWIAGRLLEHFEGRAPSVERSEHYAVLLRAKQWNVGALLRELFLDPEFYSDEIVGARIAGPIEYLVGASRRLGVDPPPILIALASGQLGQRLFDPPNVKGWPGGRAWISTSTMMARGNVAGMLIGVVRPEDVIRDDLPMADPDDPSIVSMTRGEESGAARGDDETLPPRGEAARRRYGKVPGLKGQVGADFQEMRRLIGQLYQPGVNLVARMQRQGAALDAEIVAVLSDELLGVPLSQPSRQALLDFLHAERALLELGDGELAKSESRAERLLRRLAHLILSLPEAQLS